MTYIVYA